jgi:UDP-N-acetylmuramoyl-tripeptide--D-alanyl-D-alanine ligase
MRFTAADVASATGGDLRGENADIDGASFDSRTLRPGQLFVPIVADRDGHEFIAAAIAAGAAAYLTAGPAPAGAPAVVVDDTTAALLRLGRWARQRFPDRVVGITGSVGKTSVKDLTAAVLRAHWRTAANEKSFNNDWGLPITILNAPDNTEALVLEMGMRGFGEIDRLCEVGRPHVGVVTRVAAAHTGRVGGIEGVARAKGELIEALPAGGAAILNADDPYSMGMASLTDARILTFGRHAGEVRVEALTLDAEARPRFTLATPWGNTDIALAVSGEHMAVNAAAAAAVGLVLDVPIDAIAPALADAHLSPWRMEMLRSVDGGFVLNDAYNANPASMRAALATLLALPVTRRIAVLGIMAELDDPDAEHASLAAEINAAGVELIAVGTDRYGVAPTADPVAAVGSVGRDCAVLVKGSRVAGLERIALAIAALGS